MPSVPRSALPPQPNKNNPQTDEEIIDLLTSKGILDSILDPYDCEGLGDTDSSVRRDMVRIWRLAQTHAKTSRQGK